MSKELEAYFKIDHTLCLNSQNIKLGIDVDEHIDCRNVDELTNCLETIREALNELEAIKNVNPSVALKCLEKICVCARVTGLYKKEDEDVVKQALIKYQEQDFKYKNIVIPFFNELADLLGTNDIDEMLDKIKEVLKQQEPKQYLKWEDLEFILKNGFTDKNGIFHEQVYLAYIDEEWCICDLKTDEWFLVSEVLE